MPSHRAILADIAEMRLDPTVPHTVTRTAGRLAPIEVSASAVVEQVSQAEDPVTPGDVVPVVEVQDSLEVSIPKKEKIRPTKAKKQVVGQKSVLKEKQLVDDPPMD